MEILILALVLMGIEELVTEPRSEFAISKLIVCASVAIVLVINFSINFGLLAFLAGMVIAYLAMVVITENRLLLVLDTVVFFGVSILAVAKWGSPLAPLF